MFFVNWLRSIFLFIILSKFVLSGKNQKVEQFETATNQCPAKKLAHPSDEKNEDENITQLVAVFKNYMTKAVGKELSKRDNLSFKLNSIKLLLQQMIDDLLAFMRQLGAQMHADETAGEVAEDENMGEWFLEEIEKLERNWHRIGHRMPGLMDPMGNNAMCLMYNFGVLMRKLLVESTENNGKYERKAQKYLKQKQIAAIISLESVDCDKLDELLGLMQQMTSPAMTVTINGKILMELLEKSENFRHFLCHEISNVEQTKLLLNKMINAELLIKLESQFPEILRIGKLLRKIKKQILF